MKKSEIKKKVNELLDGGQGRTETFAALAGQGLKDKPLALLVASYPDPQLCEVHRGKVRALVVIMLIQAIFIFFVGYGIGSKIGPNARWITAFLVTAIPLIFAWGFYKNRAGTYGAYLLLSFLSVIQTRGFSAAPIATSVGLILNFALMAYVVYVQGKVFPDIAFMSPKKKSGKFIFST